MTKFTQLKALHLIARGNLTFDEMVVLHRVVRWAGGAINECTGPLRGGGGNYSKEMHSGSEAGSYLRPIDACITQALA